VSAPLGASGLDVQSASRAALAWSLRRGLTERARVRLRKRRLPRRATGQGSGAARADAPV
jgi:hypothetical protein